MSKKIASLHDAQDTLKVQKLPDFVLAMDGTKMKEEIKIHDNHLSMIRKLEFDIHQFARECHCVKTLPLMTTKVIYDAELSDMVQEKELTNFLTRVTSTYN